MISEGLGFSVDLDPADGTLVGYRAKPHGGVIDLDNVAGYEPDEFWEEIHTSDGRIILDPGAFYILVSREAVTIPTDSTLQKWRHTLPWPESFESITQDSSTRDSAGPRRAAPGSRGVLEVRCHEAPFVLEHGQIVGRLVYERMSERPAALYGNAISSSYQGQGLKLSKQFRMG